MDAAHALIELQEKDLALLRLNKQLDELPEKRAILAARTRLGEMRALVGRSDAGLRAIDAELKRFEDEAVTLNGTIDEEQGKLLSGAVKNPKELQAISLELDALKRRLEKLEQTQLAAMQRREDAGAQNERIRAAIVSGEQIEAQLTGKFKEHGGALLAAIEAENRQRDVLLEAIPADLRDRYEAIRDARHGIGVGVLEAGMCTACRVGLPAGKIDVLMSGPDVGTCPNCQRLLVVRGL